MKRQINLKKTTRIALVANTLQIVLVLILALILFIKSSTLFSHLTVLRWFILFIGLIVSWGAIMDIRQAFDARRIAKQRLSLEKTIGDVENLNNTLRAQRHDFLNHLQTVYGLMEMDEFEEANLYIEKVYGEIASVSKMLRTANPSVNALLQVKVAAMEEKNISVSLNIKSSWEGLPIPGWEMCRVFGNILDNAQDALIGTPEPKVTIELTEDLKSFYFSISNNGPMIPEDIQETVFFPNITTKMTGEGMGLFISKKIMEKWQGSLSFTSDQFLTAFQGQVPKTATPEPNSSSF